MNSKILLVVVIVLFIGVASAGYQISNQTPGLSNPIATQNPVTGQQISSGDSSSGNMQGTSSGINTSSNQGQNGLGSVNVKISSSEAKAIAQKRILEPSASAGTPKLELISGKPAYVVPVIVNGTIAGEFVVDAQTGAIIEGAGGAP